MSTAHSLEEEMETEAQIHIPKPTRCLLIGAAVQATPLVDGKTYPNPMFATVQRDLTTMVNWCSNPDWGKIVTPQRSMTAARPGPQWRSLVKVEFLVNDSGLLPSTASGCTNEATMVMNQSKKTLYNNTLRQNSKEEVRKYVQEFIEASPEGNLLIFFSGDGHLKALVDKEKCEKVEDNPRQLTQMVPAEGMQHALLLPGDVNPGCEEPYDYTDEELTADIANSLAASPSKNVYIVLCAPFSGGMLHGWQLKLPQRISEQNMQSLAAVHSLHPPVPPLKVALFASSGAESADNSDNDYVGRFTFSAKPGRKLNDIQADIFRTCVEANRPTPSLVTIRPQQAKELFLRG